MQSDPPHQNGQGQGQQNLDSIFNADAQKGAAVHTFNPDASPSEKASAAGKARDQLKSVDEKQGVGEREVAIDTGNSRVVPTITVEDTDSIHQKEQVQPSLSKPTAEPQAPGALPSTTATPIPDWYKVGWRAVSNIDAPPLEDGEEKDKSVLGQYLSEQYYGAWYHNAALIVFAVFASHFLTRFHFGWGWLFILLAFCNTYYSTSMTRIRRASRDDIQRELVKTRLASEHESADWINNFLDRFWLIYEPVLSATIISSVDQVLSTNTPPFLDSLRLSTFTLGTKAPRIDRVRTHPRTADDIVIMDWGLSFTPNDIENMTRRQVQAKVNPKIVLSVRVGKGLASASMPILLEDITFSGLLRVRMKLMTNFPHVQVVDLCFLEKPVIDYVLKPIGGETFGFDIANVPGLSAFIRDMVHGTLGPMMYDPNVFTLNLEQMLSGAPIDTAIGVLQITVQTARGIKGTKIGGGTPDPFVGLSINNRAELARTKYKHNTYNPTWMETKFLLINALNESLILSVYDYNDHRKDSLLGSATFDLSVLQEDATQEGIESHLLKDGKERGEIRYDVSYYPVLKPEIVDGKEELPDTKVGIVRLTIHQAKDLDSTKSMSGDLNPFAKVHLGGGQSPAIHKTDRLKHTNNPVWESTTEFLCADKASSVISIKVIDDRDFLRDPLVGYIAVRLEDLLDPGRREAGQDWWKLSSCKSGRLRLSAEWKPLNMAGSLHGAEQYKRPIGVVRLHLDRATDVKNVEAALGGKSDPYMRVQVNNVTKGRTEVVNNNLNPVWDQIIYVPVHSLKESLLLECMDYQHLTKDRSLGSVELRVSGLAKASTNTETNARFPFESTGRKSAVDPIRLDRGNTYKGQLHYNAEFIPAVAVRGIKFDAGDTEMQKMVDAADIDGAEDGHASGDEEDEEGGDVKLDGEDSDPGTPIPDGITTRAPVGATFNGERRHTKGARSTDTMRTMDSVATAQTSKTTSTNRTKEEEPREGLRDEGVEIPREELLQQQSGIIIFNVKSGRLTKKARLEVLLDDGYWPAFSTTRARSTHAQWDHVGEGVVKELDFGRVWLRLNEADEGEKDDVVGEWKCDAKPFLQQTLDGPSQFTLIDEAERRVGSVEIEARYVPVPVTLEPRESINNQGVLRVSLLDGREIHGVDRGGKSDPFAVFSLNGQRVFKSQTKKKTLSPDWHEDFVISVPSRVGANFSVEIFDWNQIEQAKSLGLAQIDLKDLEPFQAADRILNLSSQKHGEKGQVHVRLMFQPEIIAKSRKNTSTFSAAGRAMTQIGALPVGAGKGVLHGVTGVFKKEKDYAKGNGAANTKEQEDLPPVPDIPSGQASHPVGGDAATAFPSFGVGQSGAQEGLAPTEPGTLRVMVMDAKDLSTSDIKPYVTVRVGDKEHKTKHAGKTATPEWNESFTFTAGPATLKLYAWVHDHKTLGKDKLLGDAEVDIWRHIKPGQVQSAEVYAELREGMGLLRLRLEFDADSNSGDRGSSFSSVDRSALGSPSRFSLRGRRPEE